MGRKMSGVMMVIFAVLLLVLDSFTERVHAQAASRTTVDGMTCAFPVLYRGEVKNDCFELAGQMKCKTEMGLWKVCAPPGTAAAPRVTMSGEFCVFPQNYRGETLTDCAMIAGKSQCKTEKGIWQECAPAGTTAPSPMASAPAPAGTRTTLTGEACVFPQNYRGETLTDCAVIAGRSQCKTERGIWQECAPASSVGMVAPAGGRVTKSGATCVFPMNYRGEVLTDCAMIAGRSQCKTERGIWEECAPTSFVGAVAPAGPRVTKSGASCVFPVNYRGETLTDCAMIAGRSQCKTERGVWEECAAASSSTRASGARMTVNGNACSFPFEVRGAFFDKCTMILGKPSCKTASGQVEECAPVASTSTPAAAPAPVVPPGARVSLSGSLCVFPQNFRGEVLTDCAIISGKQQCKTEKGVWEECAPRGAGSSSSSAAPAASGARVTVGGDACVFPVNYRGEVLNDCALVSGKQQCKTEKGIWQECAPSGTAAPSSSSSSSAASSTRVTVGGDACVFPQIYRGEVLTDCALVSGKEQCKTQKGIWQQCAPAGTAAPSSSSPAAAASGARTTVTGKACAFPFEVRGAFFDDCTMLLGKQSCRVADGTIEECTPPGTAAPSSSAAPTSSVPAGARVTITGAACVFPQVYRGQVLNDCALLAGRSQCRTSAGIWQECAPLGTAAPSSPAAPSRTLGRTTVRGKQCAIPFTYRGATFDDCTMIVGKMSCLTERGDVEECAPPSPLAAAIVSSSPAAAASGARTTVTGKACVFPFEVRGAFFDDCTMLLGKQSCRVADGTIEECTPPGTAAPSSSPSPSPSASSDNVYNVVSIFPRYALSSGAKLTVSGKECVFPFNYRGDTVYDCLLVSGVSRCKTEAGIFEECAESEVTPESSPSSPPAGATVTVSGSPCVFPSVYRGEVSDACIAISGKLQCRSEKGIWEECASSSSSPTPSPSSPAASTTTSGGTLTVAGEQCVFPTTYRGQVLDECAMISGKKQCKTERGLWQECAAPSAAPAAPPAMSGGVMTVSGNACVFPLVYRGEVFTSCIDVAGGKRCRTSAGIFEECAAGSSAPPASSGSSAAGDDDQTATISFPYGSYYDQVYSTLSGMCTDEVSTYFTPACRFTALVVDYDPSNAGEVIEAKMRQIGDDGKFNHVIVAGYEFGDPTEVVSKSYPTIRYSVLDFPISPPLVNVEGIIFRDDQVGYLAGMVACQISAGMTSRVAVIGGTEDFTTLKRVNGFRSGCVSVCASCAVDFQYDSTFESIEAQLAASPDVVFGSGTPLGHDALKLAASQGIYVIGVDADEWETTFRSGAVAGANMVLTSAMKMIDVAAEASLNDGLDDSFRARNVLVGVADDALALAGCHDACDVFTPALQTQTRIALANIKSGSIDTGVHRVTGEPLVSLPPAPRPPVSSAYKVLGLFPTSPPFAAGSYYDQVYQTLSEQCTPRLGCEFTAAALSGPGEVQSTLAERAGSGLFDHIIMAGAQFGDPVKLVAPTFPLMRFTVMDYAFAPPLQNVEGIIFRDDQIGFLAGVVACEVALDLDGPAANVAVVAGPQDMASATLKRVNGFKAGCSIICADCGVDVLFGTSAMPMSMKISLKYPSVVFGSGTPVSHEVLASAAGFGIYVIGVDGDEYISTFDNGSKAGAERVLTSALKMLDAAAARSLRDGLSNTFMGRNVLLDVGDDALAMAECHDACDVYTEPLRQQTDLILSALASGEMDTGINRVTGQATGVPTGTIPTAEASDDSSGGGISGVAIAIIVIVSVVALGLAIFTFVVLYKEKKGTPMFVTLDEEEVEKGKENELVANRSFSNVSSESSIKV